MRQLDYITLNHIDDFQFFQLPKRLFREDYASVPDGAKILYGVLLSRTRLSQKNKWIDEDGHVYIIYPNDELCAELGRSETTISSYKKALADNGLIEMRKNGFKGYVIYVKNINSDNCQLEVTDNCQLEVTDNCQLEVTENEAPHNINKNKINTDNIESVFDTLTQAQYGELCAIYGRDLVGRTLRRATQYKHCDNYATLRQWLEEAQKKRANGEKPQYRQFIHDTNDTTSIDGLTDLERELLSNYENEGIDEG